MPRQEWSFFMKPEDHRQVKWLLSFLQAKFTVWGRIIFGMILVGMAISSVGTQIAAYFLPSLIFALFLVSALLSLFSRPKLEAVRALAGNPVAGGVYVYRVIVTNTGKKPLRNVEVFDHKLPYGLYAFEGHPEYKNDLDWLEPGQQAVLKMAWRIPRRGTYELEPLIAGSSFPTGLVRAVKRVAGRGRFIVHPRVIELGELTFPMRPKFQAGGAGSSFRSGQSNEFLSTREYREGDRLRDVHWSSSARAGKLIVKEYVDEYFIRAGVFLDTELKRFEKHKCFEYRISICAGIAESFNNNNYQVDLFLNDGRNSHFQCGRGRDHLSHLLDMLSAVEGEERVGFERSFAGIKEYSRELSGIVLLLKDWDERRAGFVKAVRDLDLLVKVIIVRDGPLSLAVTDEDVVIYTGRQLDKRA